MTDKEFLIVVWAAINANFDPIEVMHFIERRVGVKNATDQWQKYNADDRGAIKAIASDLKKA